MFVAHDQNEALSRVSSQATGRHNKRTRVKDGIEEDRTVLVQASMPLSQKRRFAAAAKEHGLGLSAFVRLACDDYIRRHGWE